MKALRRRLAGDGGREQGQIMLLTLAFGTLVLALVLVVASASAVHIERKRLLALADGAAADAADAIDLAAYYAAPAGAPGAARGRRHPDPRTAILTRPTTAASSCGR